MLSGWSVWWCHQTARACFYWSLLLAVGVLPASEFRTHGSPIAVKHKPQWAARLLNLLSATKVDVVQWLQDPKNRALLEAEDEFWDAPFRPRPKRAKDVEEQGHTTSASDAHEERNFMPLMADEHLNHREFATAPCIRAACDLYDVDIVVVPEDPSNHGPQVTLFEAHSATLMGKVAWESMVERLQAQAGSSEQRRLVVLTWNGYGAIRGNHYNVALVESTAGFDAEKEKQVLWLLKNLEDPKVTGNALLKLPEGVFKGDNVRYDRAGLAKRVRAILVLLHPDKVPEFYRARATEAVKRVNNAYSNLKDGKPLDDGDEQFQTPERPRKRSAPDTEPRDGGFGGAEPQKPVENAKAVEDSVIEGEWGVYVLSITCSFKKKPGAAHAPLDDNVRNRHARHIVDEAHLHSAALEEAGLCTLYSDSVERGTDPKHKKAHHVQAFRRWHSRGGVETAILACEAYYRACILSDRSVVVTIYIKLIGEDQDDGDLFEYTFKQRNKTAWFHNHHGGKDYDPEEHAQWRREWEERHSNHFSAGFQKSEFNWGESRDGLELVKVDNNNAGPLTVRWARRNRLHTFGASILRRLAWMLQTGEYDIAQSMVSGKYGSSTDRSRFEAFSLLNEDPKNAATDLKVVDLVFCGLGSHGVTSYTMNKVQMSDVLYRASWMPEIAQVENMDLMDAYYYRDNGGAMPYHLARSAQDFRSHNFGTSVVIDLGYNPDSAKTCTSVFDELDFNRLCPQNMCHIHSGAVDTHGYLSLGYIHATLDMIVRHQTQYMGHGPTERLEHVSFRPMTPRHYRKSCTPIYYNYVHTPSPNPTLEQLAGKFGLDNIFARATGHSPGTRKLHEPLTPSQFSAELLVSLASSGLSMEEPQVGSTSIGSRLHAAIVRQDTPKVHHFAVVWIVYAKKGA